MNVQYVYNTNTLNAGVLCMLSRPHGCVGGGVHLHYLKRAINIIWCIDIISSGRFT